MAHGHAAAGAAAPLRHSDRRDAKLEGNRVVFRGDGGENRFLAPRCS